jgi:hypothetical protein
MVVDEGQRLRMVGRLHEVLGDDVADTLMGYLPPGGWAEVATKGDLAELRGEMVELRAELRGEMAGLRADLHTAMAELRATVLRDNRSLFFGLVGVFAAYGAALVTAVRLR